MKTCKRCQQNKPASAFRPDPRYRDGLGSWCASRHRERAAASEDVCVTLYAELSGKTRRGRMRGRIVRPMGAWEIYEPDPEIRREESARLKWTRHNRRRYGKA